MTLHTIQPEMSRAQSLIEWFKNQSYNLENLPSEGNIDPEEAAYYDPIFIEISIAGATRYSVSLAYGEYGSYGAELLQAVEITLEGALLELKKQAEQVLRRGSWE